MLGCMSLLGVPLPSWYYRWR